MTSYYEVDPDDDHPPEPYHQVAAIRAALALADEFAETPPNYGGVIARELRRALAAALAGRPDPQPDQGSTGAAT